MSTFGAKTPSKPRPHCHPTAGSPAAARHALGCTPSVLLSGMVQNLPSLHLPLPRLRAYRAPEPTHSEPWQTNPLASPETPLCADSPQTGRGVPSPPPRGSWARVFQSGSPPAAPKVGSRLRRRECPRQTDSPLLGPQAPGEA